LIVETEVFTGEEVDIALELIDIVLDKPGQKDYIINVYDDEGAVIGYYCIGPTPATESTYDLYWIATKPSGQKRGVGSALDEHAHAVIRSRGGRLVIAETSSQPKYDKTRRFYVARGYTELSRIRDYYRVGDDLVVYGKYLT
jgi:ribosomal protein S18 acetylase RimI-like enzyme